MNIKPAYAENRRGNTVMDEDKLRMYAGKFSDDNGKTVDGVTILIDGKLKRVLDLIKEKEAYENYCEVLKEMIFTGIGYYVENKK
ncbi:MAG: hypothetical protein LBI03_09560 [Clostridiales bacterium]|jgi:hypothetical protein|nr:hypothetical protein [Clostridiales bacterium]